MEIMVPSTSCSAAKYRRQRVFHDDLLVATDLNRFTWGSELNERRIESLTGHIYGPTIPQVSTYVHIYHIDHLGPSTSKNLQNSSGAQKPKRNVEERLYRVLDAVAERVSLRLFAETRSATGSACVKLVSTSLRRSLHGLACPIPLNCISCPCCSDSDFASTII